MESPGRTLDSEAARAALGPELTAPARLSQARAPSLLLTCLPTARRHQPVLQVTPCPKGLHERLWLRPVGVRGVGPALAAVGQSQWQRGRCWDRSLGPAPFRASGKPYCVRGSLVPRGPLPTVGMSCRAWRRECLSPRQCPWVGKAGAGQRVALSCRGGITPGDARPFLLWARDAQGPWADRPVPGGRGGPTTG